MYPSRFGGWKCLGVFESRYTMVSLFVIIVTIYSVACISYSWNRKRDIQSLIHIIGSYMGKHALTIHCRGPFVLGKSLSANVPNLV